jgi:hypothetical protein
MKQVGIKFDNVAVTGFSGIRNETALWSCLAPRPILLNASPPLK